MTGNDDRLDEIEQRLAGWPSSDARLARELIRELRDARAGSINANEILGRIHDALGLGWNPADANHSAAWCDSEHTVQAVIRTEAELRDARAEAERAWAEVSVEQAKASAADQLRVQRDSLQAELAAERAENHRLREMWDRSGKNDLIEALAAERAKVQRVEALADEWERDEAYHCANASGCIRCVSFQRAVVRVRAVLAGGDDGE